MSCSEWSDYGNALTEFAFRDAILCPLQTKIGGPELALLMFGAVFMAMSIRQGSFIMAFVISIIFGGLILAQVANIGVTIIGVVVIIALGALPVIYLKRRLAQ